MKDFEEDVKKNFSGKVNPFSGVIDDVSVSVPGFLKLSERNIHRGKLIVPGEEFKNLFKPVMDAVSKLVRKQLERFTDTKAVILVGGFGGSEFLRNCIQEVVATNIAVLQPRDAWVAVVCGALLRSFHDVNTGIDRIAI
jgi:hypothetical protein